MSSSLQQSVTADDIVAARERIKGYIRSTPTMRKEALAQRFGVPVYLKGEHLQRTGSFKLRGALNLVSQLSESECKRGVVAASAGNHAQGVAVAAAEFGIPSRIFMPIDATLSKVEATRNYGAEVVLVGENLSESLESARAFAEESGAVFVHPFDDARIVAGQGTIGLEIVEAVPDVETVIIPIGGGGLFAGIGTAVRALRPDCKLIGVQSAACSALNESLQAGHPVSVSKIAPTMADGIAVKQPGAFTLPAIQELLDELIIVDDDQLSRAMLWLIERAKQIVEGAGAASVAALLDSDKLSGTTVCLLSGGNIDPVQLMSVVRYGLTTVGRFVTLSTTIVDRPGELSRLLILLAELRVNILHVEHRREGVSLHVGDTQVDMTLQTRNREHVTDVLARLAAEGYNVQVLGS